MEENLMPVLFKRANIPDVLLTSDDRLQFLMQLDQTATLLRVSPKSLRLLLRINVTPYWFCDQLIGYYISRIRMMVRDKTDQLT